MLAHILSDTISSILTLFLELDLDENIYPILLFKINAYRTFSPELLPIFMSKIQIAGSLTRTNEYITLIFCMCVDFQEKRKLRFPG